MHQKEIFPFGRIVVITIVYSQLFLFNHLHGQPNVALEEIMRTKIDSLNDLSWEMRNQDDSASAHFAMIALREAQKIEYQIGKAHSWNMLGIYYRNRGDFEKAKVSTVRSLDIRKKISDAKMIAGGFNNLATIYRQEGNLPKAISYYDSSYAISESIQNMEELAKVSSNIGLLHKKLGNFEESFSYLSNCKKIREVLGDSLDLGRTALAMGGLFESQKELSKALIEYKLALKCFENENSKREVAYALNNLGNIYYKQAQFKRAANHYELSKALKQELSDWLGIGRSTKNLGLVCLAQGKVDKALENLTQSVMIFDSINTELDLAETLKEMGEIYIQKGEPDKAMHCLLRAEKIIEHTDANIIKMEVFQALAQLFASKDMYQEAYSYRANYDALYTDIDASYRASAQMNQLFLAEEHRNRLLKKENELIKIDNARLAAESRFSRLAIVALVLLLGFLAAFFFLRFRIIRTRQRALIAEHNEERSIQKISELLRDQEVKTLNAKMKGEESERRRIAKELHDSLGSLLSAIKLYIVDPVNEVALSKAETLLEKAIGEVRTISRNLSSLALSKFGLETALKELANRVNASKKVNFKVLSYGLEERLHIDLELDLYRIIQELTSNTLNHSGATEVQVQLVRSKRTLNLTFEDNGSGFDQDKVVTGMGLQNIAARVAQLYGELSFDSSLRNGTLVSIDLPIKDPNP